MRVDLKTFTPVSTWWLALLLGMKDYWDLCDIENPHQLTFSEHRPYGTYVYCYFLNDDGGEAHIVKRLPDMPTDLRGIDPLTAVLCKAWGSGRA